jgi:hypothetical protein
MIDRRRPRLERCFLAAWRTKRPPDAPQLFDLRFDPHWQLESATRVGDAYGDAASCMEAELAGLVAQAEAPPPPILRAAVGCWLAEDAGLLPLTLGCERDADCVLKRFDHETSACCTCTTVAVLARATRDLDARCRDAQPICVQSCLQTPGTRAACVDGVCRVGR